MLGPVLSSLCVLTHLIFTVPMTIIIPIWQIKKLKYGEDKPQEVAQIIYRGCKWLNIGQCFQMATLPSSGMCFSTPVSILPPRLFSSVGPWLWLLSLLPRSLWDLWTWRRQRSWLAFWLEYCHERFILPRVLEAGSFRSPGDGGPMVNSCFTHRSVLS